MYLEQCVSSNALPLLPTRDQRCMNVVSHEATTKLGGNEPAAALELNASILILEDRLLFRESLATAVAAA